MHLFVGSTNPVKINAVLLAASETFPEAVAKGFETQSGVSAQPKTDEETRKGAENRAKLALKAGLAELPKNSSKEVVLGVGLEGGIFEQDGEMWSTVWCAVTDTEGKVWVCNGARIHVPDIIAKGIRAGEEMGDVMQKLTGINGVRQKQGMFGVITQNFIDRTEEYAAIAKMAIGLWYGRNWQNDLQ
jgi:inosine/xanthosine triphosphatase